MRYLCAFALLGLTSFAFAQHEEMKMPPIASYEKVLKDFTDWSKNVADIEFYKDAEVKADGKTKKLSELPEFEQNMFFIYQAEKMSNHLMELKNAWNNELDKQKAIDDLNLAVKIDKANPTPTQAQIKVFIVQLDTLRQKHAVNFEAIVTDTFEKYKDEIPQEDRDHYLKEVKDWNDQQKLVNRTPKAKK